MANEKEVRKLTATNMLKAKFAELNLTQGEVAEKLGISKPVSYTHLTLPTNSRV